MLSANMQGELSCMLAGSQDIFVIVLGRFHLLCPCEWYGPVSMAVDFVNKSVTVLTKTRKTKTIVPGSIGALFPACSMSVSLYELSPSQLTDTMWERYSPPARPFRTFQNKAVVSSNCAQCPAAPSREPDVLFTPLPASSLSDEVLLKPSRVFDLISRSSTDYFFLLFLSSSGRLDHI